MHGFATIDGATSDARPRPRISAPNEARNTYTIEMFRRLLALSVAILITNIVRADSVKPAGQPAFRQVQLTDFRDGQLSFRGVSRQILRVPLVGINRVSCDDVPALGRAEQALGAGDVARALDAYDEALEAAPSDWLCNLIRCRRLAALNRSGRLTEALQTYDELCREMPFVASLVPQTCPPAGAASNPQTRARVAALLERAPDIETRQTLGRLLLELYLQDEVADVPAFLLPASAPPRTATPKTAAPDPNTGGFFFEREIEDEPELETAVLVELPPDSPVFDSIRAALRAGRYAEVRRRVIQALPYTPAARVAACRLLAGRALLGAEQYEQAAAELMSLADAGIGGPAEAAALYYAALAQERLGRGGVAQYCLLKLSRRDDIPADLVPDIRAAMTRLGMDASEFDAAVNRATPPAAIDDQPRHDEQRD